MALKWYGDERSNELRTAIHAAILDGLGMIDEEQASLIQSGSKSGRTYVRRGVEHVASAPGEAPASDTGNLVQNTSQDIQETGSKIRGVFTWRSLYAIFLEFGTVKIEPRPFARVSLQNRYKEIQAGIKRNVKRVF